MVGMVFSSRFSGEKRKPVEAPACGGFRVPSRLHEVFERNLKLPKEGKIYVHFHGKKKIRMPVRTAETKTRQLLAFARHFAWPALALAWRSVTIFALFWALPVGWQFLMVREAVLLVQEVKNLYSAWVEWRSRCALANT
ncbi:hypothetical protein [Streptomyces davaonensis]|uniref:hypothetical protein n=1 Tax=Streptomyces davaonensis TaxID=348043 RepID=UPI0012FFB58C|nr:hypothetical protein [Streptomyces davaonensis]